MDSDMIWDLTSKQWGRTYNVPMHYVRSPIIFKGLSSLQIHKNSHEPTSIKVRVKKQLSAYSFSHVYRI